MKITAGWIGTGIMGKSMASHILKAGHKLFVYNRTREKKKQLKELGAEVCSSVSEVAKNSDVVFSIVGYPSDVREIYFGKDGIIGNSNSGSIFVDMTTSQPSLAEEIAEAAAEKGCMSLDAPVSGGDIEQEARLAIRPEETRLLLKLFFLCSG